LSAPLTIGWALARHVPEHVAHEVHTAALPLRAQDLPDGVLEALMGVADDELHTTQAARHERAQKAAPLSL
jgi:hypothetical protein